MATLRLIILDAIYATPEVEQRKVAAPGLFSTELVAQLIYGQGISPPEAEKRRMKELYF